MKQTTHEFRLWRVSNIVGLYADYFGLVAGK